MIVEKTRDWSGRLYIDNVDAFSEYGLFVLDGEYKSLVQMPSFKKLDSTEWAEYDGEEYDLSAPVLNYRTIQMEFGVTKVRFLEDLFASLSDGACHTFNFVELSKTFTLRLSQNNSIDSFYRLGRLKLTMIDDFPIVPNDTDFMYALGATEVTQRGYEINNVDFSQFGVWVLDGSDDSIRKSPQVRPALSTDVRTLSGLIYDSQDVHFKSKDVTLKCLINCGSVSEFWKRWSDLFMMITQPEIKEFYFSKLDRTFDCFYKSNSVSRFKILRNGHVWCEFNLVLCFIGNGLRPLSQYALLLTEDVDETFVVLEDGETMIEIRPNKS